MGRNWIKIETVTCDKPEVCVVATQLKVDPDMVVGKLVRLWSWAEVNRINGNEMSVTFEFIDKLVGKKGFAAALAKAGWLRTVGDKLQFPNFGRHNGPSGKGRALTAQRVSRHRDRKRNEDDAVLENEKAEEEVIPRRAVPKTKPRNERRNTVKELIESALEVDDTENKEEILPADASVIRDGEANQVQPTDANEAVGGLTEEVAVFQAAVEPEIDETVTMEMEVEEVFDTAHVTETPRDDEETSVPSESSFATVEVPLQEVDLPAVEEEEADPAGLSGQKGKRVRAGLGTTRKVIVPETPDQPLLF